CARFCRTIPRKASRTRSVATSITVGSSRNRPMTDVILPAYPLIDDAPDATFLALGDVQRAVGALRDAIGAIGRLVRAPRRGRPGEIVGEHLELSRRLPAGERLEGDVVAVLIGGRAVPGAVERDERAALVLLRQHRARVEHQIDRRPVRRERRDRELELAAASDRLAVAAVLRVEQ